MFRSKGGRNRKRKKEKEGGLAIDLQKKKYEDAAEPLMKDRGTKKKKKGGKKKGTYPVGAQIRGRKDNMTLAC